MLKIGVQHQANSYESFATRLNASIGRISDQSLYKFIDEYLHQQNVRMSLSALDRYDSPLRPWKVRKGTSDYHGRRYAEYTNAATLVPFGTQSRRIDAFVVRATRRRLFGIGLGPAELRVGYTVQAGQIPLYWAAQDRDVLGLSPKTQRGLSLLLTRYVSGAHGMLKLARQLGV